MTTDTAESAKEAVMNWAPGPYTTVDIGNQGPTSFHSYVVDADGRKIAAVWGPPAQKVWTAALLAESWEMYRVLKLCASTYGSEKRPNILEASAAQTAIQNVLAKVEGR